MLDPIIEIFEKPHALWSIGDYAIFTIYMLAVMVIIIVLIFVGFGIAKLVGMISDWNYRRRKRNEQKDSS